MTHSLEHSGDHDVLVTLDGQKVRAESIPSEEVGSRVQDAMARQSLVKYLRNLDGRTAAIIAAEIDGGEPLGGRKAIIQWARSGILGALEMIREEEARSRQRYIHVDDLESSVTRS